MHHHAALAMGGAAASCAAATCASRRKARLAKKLVQKVDLCARLPSSHLFRKGCVDGGVALTQKGRIDMKWKQADKLYRAIRQMR